VIHLERGYGNIESKGMMIAMNSSSSLHFSLGISSGIRVSSILLFVQTTDNERKEERVKNTVVREHNVNKRERIVENTSEGMNPFSNGINEDGSLWPFLCTFCADIKEERT
jgi:hypothetical protein